MTQMTVKGPQRTLGHANRTKTQRPNLGAFPKGRRRVLIWGQFLGEGNQMVNAVRAATLLAF